jgi:glutathione S-transferase
MLTVWGRRSSFNLQKVMWLVGELGLEHRHIEAGGRFGGLDTPEFTAMNPHGRVPVIDDDGTIVWESHAILRYLAARHGRFWSDDPGARSQVDRWMDWSQTALQPDFLMGVFWGFLPDAGAAAKLARYPRQGRPLRRPFQIAGRGARAPAIPGW